MVKKIRRRRGKHTEEEFNGARDALFEEIGLSDQGKRTCAGLMEAVKRTKRGDPTLETLAECLEVQGTREEKVRGVANLLIDFDIEQQRLGVVLVEYPPVEHQAWFSEAAFIEGMVQDFKRDYHKNLNEITAEEGRWSPEEMREANEQVIRSYDSWVNDSEHPILQKAGRQIAAYLSQLNAGVMTFIEPTDEEVLQGMNAARDHDDDKMNAVAERIGGYIRHSADPNGEIIKFVKRMIVIEQEGGWTPPPGVDVETMIARLEGILREKEHLM